jgi:hypothetical protein
LARDHSDHTTGQDEHGRIGIYKVPDLAKHFFLSSRDRGGKGLDHLSDHKCYFTISTMISQ